MNTSITTILAGKSRALHAVPTSVTVLEAVQKMNQHKVGAVLVMNGGKLAGIFTERDVMTRVIAANCDPKTTPIAQVMSADVLTIPPATTVQQVMDIFADKRCRHLPVMQGDELVGLISIGDVSRWVANAHRAEAESLRQYIAGELST
ncbi:Hypoxic response protein 1 [Lacunisphaera limnophila]|uniref:Hypoxic response protein 1 n=1 Tax=Lacunisphaera limnophila TaxID=1838286 RepID=A0A1D8AS53_9BACT|nr:CBS domain-containing protein [Lacunisphaera limnophila]AOS43699.1 Hypoxic response protein 1 [Lacunisphaera limnophila]